jgi:hypothetical protein
MGRNTSDEDLCGTTDPKARTVYREKAKRGLNRVAAVKELVLDYWDPRATLRLVGEEMG